MYSSTSQWIKLYYLIFCFGSHVSILLPRKKEKITVLLDISSKILELLWYRIHRRPDLIRSNIFRSKQKFHTQGAWLIKHILSQPKLNEQLSSTEFEVRIHSYPVIHHPPPHTNSTCILNTGKSGQLPSYKCTLQSHTDQWSNSVLRFSGRTLFFSRQKDFEFCCLRIQK